MGQILLAIETSTPVCSVALQATDGEIYEKRETGKGIHSEKLFLFIESFLNDHLSGGEPVSEVLFAGGPGSYTGLRIGAAAIKGVLFRSPTPLFLLGSLESLAAGVLLTEQTSRKPKEELNIHTAIDARRSHLYYQKFTSRGGLVTSTEPVATPLQSIVSGLGEGDILVGTGLGRLEFPAGLEENLHIVGESAVSAVNLIRARNHELFRNRFRPVRVDQFEPDYLSMGQVADGTSASSGK